MRFKDFMMNELSVSGLKRKLLTAREDPSHKRAKQFMHGLKISDELRDDMAALGLRMMGVNISGRHFGIRGEGEKTDPMKLLRKPKTDPYAKDPQLPSPAADPHV